MKEIRKTLAVFKVRWPEVTLIVALFVINSALIIFRPNVQKSVVPVYVVFSLISLALMIVGFILNYGFLRTIFLDDTKRHSPVVLVKLGSHFFWRMFVFGILMVIFHFFLQWLISLPIAPYICPDISLLQRAVKCPMFYAFQASAASLVLVKLTLFIPALIFVLDCSFHESFGLLKHCKLSKAIEATLLFCFTILFGMIFWAISLNLKEDYTELYYCSMFLRSGIMSFLTLAAATMAVRYVASLALACGKIEKPVDSETETLKTPPEP